MNERYMQELLELMEWRVQRYTSNENTSVSNNKAKELLNSALYCMNVPGLVHGNSSLKEQFRNGLASRKKKVILAKNLYERVVDAFLAVSNRCYKETILDGMPAFFKWYDLEFAARDHIITLDYPLYIPLENICGVDLIYEYLIAFQTEQKFLSHFGAGQIDRFLIKIDSEYTDNIFNLAEAVLRAVLLCQLSGKDIRCLCLSEEEREDITGMLLAGNLEGVLEQALTDIIEFLDLNKEIYIPYFSKKLQLTAFELEQAARGNTLRRVIPEPVDL